MASDDVSSNFSLSASSASEGSALRVAHSDQTDKERFDCYLFKYHGFAPWKYAVDASTSSINVRDEDN